MPYSQPAAPARTAFSAKGPVRALFSGATFYHIGDAKAELKPSVDNIKIEGIRAPSRRITDRVIKLSLTPECIFSSTVIASLWAYLGSAI